MRSPRELPVGGGESEIQRRVGLLAGNFERYAVTLGQDPDFTRSGLLGKRMATIGKCRHKGSLALKARDA